MSGVHVERSRDAVHRWWLTAGVWSGLGVWTRRCLAAGIDVGKYEALCLVADHRGEVIGEALTFPLTEPGMRALEAQLAVAVAARAAVSVRIGVETAGRYHRTVVARLVGAGHDVVELNPAHVKAARTQQGSRRLKTDLRDAAAILDLVISGSGRAPQQRTDALVEQLGDLELDLTAGVGQHRLRPRPVAHVRRLPTLGNTVLLVPQAPGHLLVQHGRMLLHK